MKYKGDKNLPCRLVRIYWAIAIIVTLALGSVGGCTTGKSGLPDSARVSMQDAQRIALEQVPGEVVGARLHKEHGQPVYEISILDGHKNIERVSVDANRGQILHVKNVPKMSEELSSRPSFEDSAGGAVGGR